MNLAACAWVVEEGEKYGSESLSRPNALRSFVARFFMLKLNNVALLWGFIKVQAYDNHKTDAENPTKAYRVIR